MVTMMQIGIGIGAAGAIIWSAADELDYELRMAGKHLFRIGVFMCALYLMLN